MNQLTASHSMRDAFSVEGLRIHKVDSDGMNPDLRQDRDYVLIRPIADFSGEGIYMIFDGFSPVLYRVSFSGNRDRPIRLTLDNPAYRHHETGGHCLTRNEFREAVLGIVVADIHVGEGELCRY